MCAGLLGRRCIIGVDRLDYSKGLVDRFKAYERFMETCPDNHNRVTFLQIAPLSRADLRAYARSAARSSRRPVASTAVSPRPTGRRSAT